MRRRARFRGNVAESDTPSWLAVVAEREAERQLVRGRAKARAAA